MVVPKQTLTPTIKFHTIPKRTIQKNKKKTEDLDLSSHPVRPVVEIITQQRVFASEQTQQTDRFPRIDDRKDKTKSNRERRKATQKVMSKLQPTL